MSKANRSLHAGKVFEDYLHDEYHTTEVKDRWQKREGEYHSSSTSKCQRAWYWDFKLEQKPPTASSFPYFLLGNMFEDLYGDALENKYGAERVRQDVNIEIELEVDGEQVELVGESDWTILRRDVPADVGLKYFVDLDGTRRECWYDMDTATDERPHSGDLLKERVVDPDSDDPEDLPVVETVIETKTTKKTEWQKTYGHKKGHEYQLMTYLHGTGIDQGYIVYMQRNDMDEYSVPINYSDSLWMDIEMRIASHHRNLQGDEVPDPNPKDQRECKFCDYRSRCAKYGGSEHVAAAEE